MAIAVTAVAAKSNGPNYKEWTATALDADTALVFAHGMNGTPTVILQEMVSYANAALPNWGVTVDGTNITLAKTNATASGGATPGTTPILRIIADLIHAIRR